MILRLFSLHLHAHAHGRSTPYVLFIPRLAVPLNSLHLDLVGLLLILALILLLLHTHFHLLSLGHFGVIASVLADGVNTGAPLHIRTHLAFRRLESLHFPVVFLAVVLSV